MIELNRFEDAMLRKNNKPDVNLQMLVRYIRSYCLYNEVVTTGRNLVINGLINCHWRSY